MFFLNDEGKNIRNSTIRLSRGKTECRAERVYIAVSPQAHTHLNGFSSINLKFHFLFQDNIRDKLTPLEVEMRFNMRENYYPGQQQQRRRRAALEPVIDQNRGTIQRDSINIQKNCGPDNVCIPDLRLTVKTVDTYILGSKDLLVFEVLISNHNEDAFEAGFFMTVPSGLNFRKIERVGDVRDTPITCTAPSAATNNTLKCDIGNPLPRDKVAHFKVILLPAQKQGMAPTYSFFMEANSTNAEAEGTGYDNVIKKEVGILVETNLSVKGVSIDEELLYNTTDYVALQNATDENQIGPQVVHIYEIRNGGPSTIDEAEVYFLWPHQTVNGDSLLYLLNQPETTKNMQCEWSDNANPRNLALDKSLVEKSFLVSQGAIEKSSSSSSWSASSSSSSSSSGHAQSGRGQSGHAVGGGQSGHAVGGGRVFTAEEERRRLDEEETRESSGDASDIHRQRAHQAAQEQFGAGSIGNYDQSSSSSWRASGSPVVYTASRNRTTFSDRDGRVHVTEFSTESYGNLRSQPTIQIPRNNLHIAGAFGTAGGGSSSSSGASVRRLEDFSAEGSVSKDLSALQSRTQATAGRRRMMSQQDGEPSRPDLITGVSQLDKVGQGGHGFQAGGLELNTLGTHDNADEDIRQRGNAASAGLRYGGASYQQHNGGGSGTYGRSVGTENSQSGSFQQSSSSSSRSSNSQQSAGRTASSTGGSSGGGTGYYQSASSFDATGEPDIVDNFNPDPEYYDEIDTPPDNQLHVTAQQLPSHHIQSHHLPSHNFNADQFGSQHYTNRLRRDANDAINFSDLELRKRLSCDNSQCAYIRCTTKKLETDNSAWIALRMRLVTETVKLVSQSSFNITLYQKLISQFEFEGRAKCAIESDDNGRVASVQSAIHRWATRETAEGARSENPSHSHTRTKARYCAIVDYHFVGMHRCHHSVAAHLPPLQGTYMPLIRLSKQIHSTDNTYFVLNVSHSVASSNEIARIIQSNDNHSIGIMAITATHIYRDETKRTIYRARETDEEAFCWELINLCIAEQRFSVFLFNMKFVRTICFGIFYFIFWILFARKKKKKNTFFIEFIHQHNTHMRYANVCMWN